jgi:phosphoribosylanthranilate isomerase
MSMLIKICGLSTPDTLETAIDAGADFVGFVFFPASPRNVTLDQARVLGARVRRRAAVAALSVDADDAALAAIVAALRPDLLQLHGHETPERITAVKRRFGLPVMKALPVSVAADLAAADVYKTAADRLLFDARPPKDATRPGGLGRPFDWRLLARVDAATPYMLSGGLNPGNVAEAIAVARPAGVDVSSGVERAPGVKDADKIGAFVGAAREAEKNLALARTA